LDWGRCTRKTNDDGSITLYLEVFRWPKNGILKVPDLRSQIAHASLLANGTSLKTDMTENGWQVHVPRQAPDSVASVIKLELDGPLELDDFAVDASADGTYHLDADFVDIHNQDNTTERIGLEGPESGIPDNKKQHVAFWSDPRNWVSWTVRIKKSGTYNLKTVLAGPVPSGKMKILVGNQQILADKKATGGYYRFKTFLAGKVSFDKPGAYRLTVQPVTEDWKPFNLKEIILQR
jgi:alpha-L-fucosidase